MCPRLTPSSMVAHARELKVFVPPAAFPPIFRKTFLNFFSLSILNMCLIASQKLRTMLTSLLLSKKLFYHMVGYYLRGGSIRTLRPAIEQLSHRVQTPTP